jgi:hypothetical protein
VDGAPRATGQRRGIGRLRLALVLLAVAAACAVPGAANGYLQATSGVEVVARFSPSANAWEITLETDTEIGYGAFNVVGASTFVPSRPQPCDELQLFCASIPSSNGVLAVLFVFTLGALPPNVGSPLTIGTVDDVDDLDFTDVLENFGTEGFLDIYGFDIPTTLVVAPLRPPFLVDDQGDDVDAAPGDGVCATTSGSCTLRAAVMEADASPGYDAIDVPSGTYRLTRAGANEDLSATGDLDIHHDLEIRGAGVGATWLDGGRSDRVLEVHASAAVTLSDVTIHGGLVSGGQGRGGGIRNAGELALDRCRFVENQADLGGAISNSGQLTLSASTVERNAAGDGGGGIWNDGTLIVTDSTLSGNLTTLGDGGGIGNHGGTVTMALSVLQENSAVSGGALRNGLSGQVTIDRSSLERNWATRGGAIANLSGTVSVVETTVQRNEAAKGGGVFNLDSMSIDSTTLSENGRSVESAGGGIHNSGTLQAVNSTISGNLADALGAGIANDGGQVVMSFCTVAANRAREAAAGGLWSSGPALLMGNLLAGNTNGVSPSDCLDASGDIVSGGANLVGNGSGCVSLATSGDQVGSIESPLDPVLDVLADNGGPTRTHALLPGSTAIDVAVNCSYYDDVASSSIQNLVRDQRSFPRPRGLGCDIGSYEASVELVSCLTDLNQCEQAVISGSGDVNGDGKIDILDSVLLRRYQAGLPVE